MSDTTQKPDVIREADGWLPAVINGKGIFMSCFKDGRIGDIVLPAGTFVAFVYGETAQAVIPADQLPTLLVGSIASPGVRLAIGVGADAAILTPPTVAVVESDQQGGAEVSSSGS